MIPRDLHSLFDIVHSAELVVQYASGVLEEDFSADEQFQGAVIKRLSIEESEHISEVARNQMSASY